MITLRSDKGSALTIQEIDGNFSALEAAIQALQAGSSTAAGLHVDTIAPVDGTPPPNFAEDKDYYINAATGEIFQYSDSVFVLVATLPSGGGGGTAASTSYDNSTSGMAAENVQAAIDELDGVVDALDTAVTSQNSRITNLENAPADDASSITYDGTTSGRGANVQAAIDSLDTEVDVHASRITTLEGAGGGGGVNTITKEGDDTVIKNGGMEVFRAKAGGAKIGYHLSADLTVATSSSVSPVTFKLGSTAAAGGMWTTTYDPSSDGLTWDYEGTDILSIASDGSKQSSYSRLIEQISDGFVRHKIQTSTAGSDPSIELSNSADSSIWSMRNDSSASNLFVIRHQFNSDPTTTPFQVTTGGNATVAGSMTATSHPTSSDERIKTNIEDANAGMASTAIDAIRVVEYDMAADGKYVPFGLIAQELATVRPDCVYEGDSLSVPAEDVQQPWAVDYSSLVPMLIKELQSVRARLSALEAT